MMKSLNGLLLMLIASLGLVTAVCPKDGCSGLVKNHTYFVNPSQKYNFYDAVDDCKQRNMSIITIDSVEKVDDVNSLLNQLFEDKSIPSLYIGAYGFLNEKFLWMTSGDNLVFSNWASGHPTGENKKCAYIGANKSGQWNNIHCTKEIGYICE